MKKIVLFVIVSLFLLNCAYSETIHFWVQKNQKDYSWENELVKELKNSKYSERFGSYLYDHEYTDINEGDYILSISKYKVRNFNQYFGSIILFKYEKIRDELLYRSSFSFNYGFDSKLEWIYDIKNWIIERIDKGSTKY